MSMDLKNDRRGMAYQDDGGLSSIGRLGRLKKKRGEREWSDLARLLGILGWRRKRAFYE